MKLQKARFLDALLLKFRGNLTITWQEFQNGLCDDIASYYIIENNINFLVGDAMLKRDEVRRSLSLTDKGFATMTDLRSLGYVTKTSKEIWQLGLQILLAVVSVVTFVLVVVRFCRDFC